MNTLTPIENIERSYTEIDKLITDAGFRQHKGIDFISADAIWVRSFQLVNLSNDRAYAIADFDDYKCVRFACTKSIQPLAYQWMQLCQNLVNNSCK